MASMADHVALDSALAGSSSSAVVTFGIVAVRAGSKNADAVTVARHHGVRDPHLIRAAGPTAARGSGSRAAMSARDHQRAAVDTINDHAGQRADDGHRHELHDHHPRDGGGRAGQVEQQRVDGDRVEPVAELRDRLADEQQAEVAIAPKERDVRIHRPTIIVAVPCPRPSATTKSSIASAPDRIGEVYRARDTRLGRTVAVIEVAAAITDVAGEA